MTADQSGRSPKPLHVWSRRGRGTFPVTSSRAPSDARTTPRAPSARTRRARGHRGTRIEARRAAEASSIRARARPSSAAERRRSRREREAFFSRQRAAGRA
eukprot:7773-Pelagococcus_subviridis.AAC.1